MQETSQITWLSAICKIGQFEFESVMNIELNVTGNQVATGIELCYRDGIDEEQYVQLTAPEDALRKQSITWIIALQTVSH